MEHRPVAFVDADTVQACPEEAAPEHRPVACFYADVWGDGLPAAEDTEETKRSLVACRDMIADVVTTYLGRVHEVLGGGLFATFLTVPAAVRCAVEVQHRMRLCNAGLPPDQQLRLRIGIELGGAAVDDGRFHGDRLDVAVRVQTIALPGGVCLSESALDRISPLLVPCQYVGERAVESGGEGVRIYQIRAGCGE
jgi:adenylate cyclase